MVRSRLVQQSLISLAIAGSVASCSSTSTLSVSRSAGYQTAVSYIGTQHPFAKESVYFVLTDRFVDGDITNNQTEQGGKHPTFNRPLLDKGKEIANIGYLGGDFKGIVNNLDYIKDMGFTSVWLSPIVDNPDESFTGGEIPVVGGIGKDKGKTGYHGYWGVNFFKVDEHWPSSDLTFEQFNQALEAKGLKTVLDIVANHGTPSFTMTPTDQPGYGEIYDKNGQLIADHQNLAPENLDPDNPLHQFYHNERDLVQLSNIDDTNPVVMDYFVEAYLQWLDQGADAFRIDTIRHMPHAFWKTFADRIRADYPGLFMFGESFEYDAAKVSTHTLPENGNISVLDFPLQKAMGTVFGSQQSGYEALTPHLYLDESPYHNVYELMTFYDNHDMPRIDADDNGFIDANNWLFTARGIPVIYYGSETGFMAGKSEHGGNRNYFGQQRINQAPGHIIHQQLTRIAHVRKNHVSLQRGLQVNVDLQGDVASFYRIYQHNGLHETALVLLNKGDTTARFSIDKYLSNGVWKDVLAGNDITVTNEQLTTDVAPHNVKVLILNGSNQSQTLNQFLQNRLTQ